MTNSPVRNLWIDYLRSAITVLVVAHHSALAYTTFAHFEPEAYINSTHPIVDSSRWVGLDIFENFNDVFFMSLMFFIGGLFLLKSIQRKGKVDFVLDRFYRLFIPFLFLGTLLMLVAYFPSYYVAHANTDMKAYVIDFFTVEKWPVGPPWFIWVLFLFNLLFALLLILFQRAGKVTGYKLSMLGTRPFAFFLLFFATTWVLYVPAAYLIGQGIWTGWGPFDFQVSRILLYFGYFTLGVLIGNTDFGRDLFSLQSTVVKKWLIWMVLALVVYVVLTVIGEPLANLVKAGRINEFTGWMIYLTIYAASCAFSCIAFITTFRRWISVKKSWWTSLSDNAYLIYLIHYVFVVWCQFLLLELAMPAFIKFLITFSTATLLSWLVSSWLRRISIVKKYL